MLITNNKGTAQILIPTRPVGALADPKAGHEDADGFYVTIAPESLGGAAGILYVVGFDATDDTPVAWPFDIGESSVYLKKIAANANNTATGVYICK